MSRIVASLEYQGTNYAGWQKNKGQITVAGLIENAISKVANHPITITAAGRTDKGVHASQQIIHFDTSSLRNARSWLNGTNRYLPDDIKLHWVIESDDSFHARFSAKWRRYTYLIYQGSTKPGLLNHYSSWVPYPLSVPSMKQAIVSIIGLHDFTAFRSTDCQSPSPLREVYSTNIEKSGQWIRFNIQANAFLHKMVRMLMAEIINVGRGKCPPEYISYLLKNGNRSYKPTASPSGLFLSQVGYDKKWSLPIEEDKNHWINSIK